MNRINSFIVTTAAAALVTLMAGCAGYQAPRTQAVSEAIDLTKLDSFAVRINGDAQDTAFGERARDDAFDALVDEFSELGYAFRDDGDADFIVTFSTLVRDEDVVFSTDYSRPDQQVIIRERQAVTPDGDIVTMDRQAEIVTTYESTPIPLASLQRLYVVDIVDGKTDVLLWRGYMTSDDIELRDDDGIEDHIERIVEEVTES